MCLAHPSLTRLRKFTTALGGTVACERYGGSVLEEQCTERYSVQVMQVVVHAYAQPAGARYLFCLFLSQDEALSQRRELEALFFKDTADAYRVFDTMEHFLCQPEHLRGQLQVQLGDETQVSSCTDETCVCRGHGRPTPDGWNYEARGVVLPSVAAARANRKAGLEFFRCIGSVALRAHAEPLVQWKIHIFISKRAFPECME